MAASTPQVPMASSNGTGRSGHEYFDRLRQRSLDEGCSRAESRRAALEAYLDGKPHASGKLKPTKSERDRWFWASAFVAECAPGDWCTDAGILTLTRYLSQAKMTVDGLVGEIARTAPQALVTAMRRAQLVLTPESPHLLALRAARCLSPVLDEALTVHEILVAAHRERQVELELCRAALADTTAFDLLLLASLHAYRYLIPDSMKGQSAVEEAGGRVEVHWDAINELLAWKLKTVPLDELKLDEERIGRAIKRYLSPLLFPEGATPPELLGTIQAFERLLAAQIELNEFLSRSVNAHCFDDSVRFVPVADHGLEILVIDEAARAKWHRDGRKLALMPGYWLHRAFYDFANSDMAGFRMGRPENEDENRLAYIRAMATQLRLREVYGVADRVTAPSRESADMFQALLSLELTARFFMLSFIVPFVEAMEQSGDWIASLHRLAWDGLLSGQNRFPLTWSTRDEKIAKTTAWTVTPSQPRGSARMAGVIVDFWTHDVLAQAERLQKAEPGLAPRLIERPYLKFGHQWLQLPWVVAMQNNGTAAINNLRRLGARRDETLEETRRIECQLADLLRLRGFSVLLNWQPPAEWRGAGEVDVIAARDGRLFVFEVKSSFMRRSMHEAWLHASSTLRKAGLQLRRKVEAVGAVLATNELLLGALGLSREEPPAHVHGWIVDTSIESDHERFGGFLKVSLEEVIVALRDDRALLFDPEGLVSGQTPASVESADGARGSTLYPSGFDAPRFVEVIETEQVWESIGRNT